MSHLWIKNSDSLQWTELEFISSQLCKVEIIPKFSAPEIKLLGGTFGPFNPPWPTEVPLWIALDLRKRKKCTIRPPAWLDWSIFVLKSLF